MSKICQITGKKAMVGNNVSHSKHRTKRSFDVNLFSKKFYYVESVPQVCALSIKWVLTQRLNKLFLRASVIGKTLKL